MANSREMKLVQENLERNRILPDSGVGRVNTRATQSVQSQLQLPTTAYHPPPSLSPSVRGARALSPMLYPDATSSVQPSPGSFVYDDHYAETPRSTTSYSNSCQLDTLEQEIIFFADHFHRVQNWEGRVIGAADRIIFRINEMHKDARDSSCIQVIERLNLLRMRLEAGRDNWLKKIAESSSELSAPTTSSIALAPLQEAIIPLNRSDDDSPFHGFSSVLVDNRSANIADEIEKVQERDHSSTIHSRDTSKVPGYEVTHLVPTHSVDSPIGSKLIFTTAGESLTNIVMSAPYNASQSNPILGHSYSDNTQTHKYYEESSDRGSLLHEIVDAQLQEKFDLEVTGEQQHGQKSSQSAGLQFDPHVLLNEKGYIACTREIRRILDEHKPGYLDSHPVLWTFILFELAKKAEVQHSSLKVQVKRMQDCHFAADGGMFICKEEIIALQQKFQAMSSKLNSHHSEVESLKVELSECKYFINCLQMQYQELKDSLSKQAESTRMHLGSSEARFFHTQTSIDDLSRQVKHLTMHLLQKEDLSSRPTSPGRASSRVDHHVSASQNVEPRISSSNGNYIGCSAASTVNSSNNATSFVQSIRQDRSVSVNPHHPFIPCSIPLVTAGSNINVAQQPRAQQSENMPASQQTSFHGTSEHIGSRVLLRTLRYTLQRVKDIISKEIDSSMAKEELHELYTSKSKTLEILISDCSKQINSYCMAPGATDQEANQAFEILEEAQNWLRKMRSVAEAKEIFSKPLDKEFRKKLQPFSNSPQMNIFDFFRQFEETVECGTKRKKARILVEEYLATWIRLQVTVYDHDYDRIKEYLITEFGNIRSITQTLLNSLKRLSKPVPGAAPKVIAKYLGTLLSGIYDMQNLRSLPEVKERDIMNLISSAEFMESLISLIPDSLRNEFNKKVVDDGMSLRNFYGYDAFDTLLEFLERETKGYQSFLIDVGKPLASHSEKSPKKSSHATEIVVDTEAKQVCAVVTSDRYHK